MAQPGQEGHRETTSRDSRISGSGSRRGIRGRPGVWLIPILLLLLVAALFVWRGGWSLGSGVNVLGLVLLFIACPLGMYFMMRGMGHMNDRDQRRPDDERQNRDH